MFEILTRWTAPSTPGGVTVMYADDLVNIDDLRSALGTLWGAIDNQLATGVTWSVDTSGRVLNAATGTLTGFWASPTPYTGTGALSGSAVANAAQILLQWRTSDIVAGRLVQGRTYVPGMGAGLLSGGQIAEASRAAMQAAAETFADAPSSISIWHRPKNGSGGSLHNVGSAACWAELAVQRRRRD